jgi:hypothetical protein
MDAFHGVAQRYPELRFRQRVINAIYDWNSDWHVETDDYYIQRVEDEDGDCIWDVDWDDDNNPRAHFSNDFRRYMDEKFAGGKKPIFVGKATILPIPGDSPSSLTKGPSPSSSF